MILRLLHVEIGVGDLAEAADFYVDGLGLVQEARTPDALYLRASDEFDRWSLKLAGGAGPGVRHIAFRVSAPDDLPRLAALHADLGLPARLAPAGCEPGSGPALRVLAPGGFPVEFVHEVAEVDLYESGGRVRL